MVHLNVEIKAHCSDSQVMINYLLVNNANFVGLDNQIDTYFKVPNGRLKLREGNIEHSLIAYNRNNQEGPKDSEVVLYENISSSKLKDALLMSCGELVIVDKQRKIYFIDNVKFHVDEVKDLGSFCEIEAIDKNGDIGREKLLQQCNYYMEELGIQEKDLISCSYSDMLLEKMNK